MKYEFEVRELGDKYSSIKVSTDYDSVMNLDENDVVLHVYHSDHVEYDYNSLEIMIHVDNLRPFLKDLRGMRDNFENHSIIGYHFRRGKEAGHPGHETKCIVCRESFKTGHDGPEFVNVSNLNIHRDCLDEFIDSVEATIENSELIALSL